MFNNEELRNPVPVQVALTDGRMLDGNLMLPLDVKFKRVLNSDGAGVEFQTHDGVDSMIAKSAIVEIIAVTPAKTEAEAEAPDTAPADDALEAYTTLGVARSAPAEQIKAAYDALRMEYHPDRFKPIGLPGDVLDYVVEKARRIDAAYTVIASRAAAQAAAEAAAAPQQAAAPQEPAAPQAAAAQQPTARQA